MTDPKPTYSVQEAAEIFDVDPESVRRWLRDEKIDGAKMGDAWKIPATEVNRWWRVRGGDADIVDAPARTVGITGDALPDAYLDALADASDRIEYREINEVAGGVVETWTIGYQHDVQGLPSEKVGTIIRDLDGRIIGVMGAQWWLDPLIDDYGD